MKKLENFSASREISPDNLGDFEKILMGVLSAQQQVSEKYTFSDVYKKACADAKRYNIPCVRELKMEDLEKLEGYYARKFKKTKENKSVYNIPEKEKRSGGSWHDRYPENY